MKVTTKRAEIKYTVNTSQGWYSNGYHQEEVTEKGYEVLVDGEFFCYISKDEDLGEWRAFKSPSDEFIAGGLTKREIMEVLINNVITK